MTNDDKYAFDPNSGASPQPGGFANAVVEQSGEATDVGADFSSVDTEEVADESATDDGVDDNPPAPEQDQRQGVGEPAGTATRDKWVEWSRQQDNADEADFRSTDEGGMGRNELRDKYGSKA